MSLFTIISDPAKGIAPRLGITAPASLFGSSDPNVPLLISIAQEEGEELARRHDWQALKVDYTVATLGAETQTALPSDYDRMPPNAELWNRTLALKYDGPTDDTLWGRIKAQGLNSTALGFYRLAAGALQITPAPTVGQTLAFPYFSTKFVRSNAGALKDAFSADTDTTVIPERLVGLGIIWRWKKSKGFAYSEAMATYEREVERAASRDRGPQAPIVLAKPRPSNGGSDSVSWPGRIIA